MDALHLFCLFNQKSNALLDYIHIKTSIWNLFFRFKYCMSYAKKVIFSRKKTICCT